MIRSTTSVSLHEHVSDGDLVALFDGEPDVVGTRERVHVEACPACRSRLVRLQQRAARFREAVTAIDPHVDRTRLMPSRAAIARARDRGRSRRLWLHPAAKAAAAVLILAGVAAASPARAWLVGRVSGRATQEARPVSSAPTRVQPSEVQPPGSRVLFTSDPGSLLIRLETRPSAGVLTVAASSDERSAARVVARRRGEEFLVLPNELRIRNSASSLASYEVIVARDIRQVRVEVDGEHVTTLDVLPRTRTVLQLGRSGRP